MKEYRFLFKPLFFIFNLLFATWLVFQIEKIHPSDFGKYRSWFEEPPKLNVTKMYKKQMLKKLISDYKKGVLDSVQLDRSLEDYLLKSSETPNK
jgi:hypothetical protein